MSLNPHLMMNKKDSDILIKSLKMIAGFADRIYYVAYSWEYKEIHSRNLQMLNELSEERSSTYILNKIKEYPEISTEEIDSYIAEKRGENFRGGTWQSYIFSFVARFIANNGNTQREINAKISKIASLNLHLVKIIENPYLEELYLKQPSI